MSQIDDLPQELFCNGDNRPADCGPNCECVHQVDIPLNAIVEVVLVDEGNTFAEFRLIFRSNLIFFSSVSKSEPSIPFAWLLV